MTKKQEIEIEIDFGKAFLVVAAVAVLIVFSLLMNNIRKGSQKPVEAAPIAPREVDITRETDRQGVRNEMIRQGTPASDAEAFTRVLSDMEKEWRDTGRVAP